MLGGVNFVTDSIVAEKMSFVNLQTPFPGYGTMPAKCRAAAGQKRKLS